MKRKLFCPFWLLVLFLFTGCGKSSAIPASFTPTEYSRISTPIDHDFDPAETALANPFSGLSVPTYITKIGQEYFIVDCYHNQVIYHDNLTDDLSAWSVMTSDIAMGHTIAGDGLVYLIDDTENNRILIMERQINDHGQPVFIPTQEFTDIGSRPHYVIYDDATDTFYAWSSLTGEMYLFRHPADSSVMYLSEIRSIPSLMGVYVRSFTIMDNDIYFVSGNSSIIKADLKTFSIQEEYPVPPQLAGMIQITRIEDYFYLTVSTDASGNQDFATLVRTKKLSSLADGGYEDVYSYFIGGGTPYYITKIEDRWYLTEHRLPGHSVWSFMIKNNNIEDVVSIY